MCCRSTRKSCFLLNNIADLNIVNGDLGCAINSWFMRAEPSLVFYGINIVKNVASFTMLDRTIITETLWKFLKVEVRKHAKVYFLSGFSSMENSLVIDSLGTSGFQVFSFLKLRGDVISRNIEVTRPAY